MCEFGIVRLASALAGISLILGLTASVACLIPAHCATKVDPMLCLRNE